MKEVIIEALTRRIEAEISPRSSLKVLKATPVEHYYNEMINTLYVFTRPRKGSSKQLITFAEVICGLGNRIRKKLRLPRDTAMAAKLGAFVLWTFEDMGVLRVHLTKGSKKHNTYAVQLLDDEPLSILWNALPNEAIDRLPSRKPWADWTSTRHESGAKLIKTNNPDVLAYVTPDNCPMIYNMVNRAQKVGWLINQELLPTVTWCLKNRASAFMDIWEANNREARMTKLREAKTIIDMASRLGSDVFYHLYFLDFRARKYPATPYLHEQGTDLARALLYRQDRERIGREGFQWLQIVLASNWAGDAGRLDKLKTDKIPVIDRIRWAEDNEDAMLSYAINPIENQGWMNADAPWLFLGGCLELKRLRDWQMSVGDMENFDYETGYEGYIDGSNNGCQHLAAMTRDEITAPHVNLVPLKLPGDLYRYVGTHVQKRIYDSVQSYSKAEIIKCRWLIRRQEESSRELAECQDPADRPMMYLAHKAFREEHKQLYKDAALVFWMQITDAKDWRKLVKRNVMTIPYGGTAFGLGQQQIDDAPKHGIEKLRYMSNSWAITLGRMVYDDCRKSLARPMRLLGVFEAAGAMADAKGEFLHWQVPGTNFPVVQHYTEGVVKKVWVQYGPPVGEKASTGYYSNTYQVALTFPEIQEISKGKQQTGVSPNATHSCDAAHLTMTVNACDFPVTTIHDSFGALLPHMPMLFRIVREQFVAFYKLDPLPKILTSIKGDISNVEFGNLDITLILNSEYAFL